MFIFSLFIIFGWLDTNLQFNSVEKYKYDIRVNNRIGSRVPTCFLIATKSVAYGCNVSLCQVHHVLNHTSGLHNSLADLTQQNPLLMSDWDESLNCIAMTTPETEPGHKQLYHYLSFGWLCGGIIEVLAHRSVPLLHPLFCYNNCFFCIHYLFL